MRPWYSGGGWLAVKDGDLQVLQEMLALADLRELPWADFVPTRNRIREDLRKVDRNEAQVEVKRLVFISPPIDGWRLLVGWRFCCSSEEDAEESGGISSYLDVARWCCRLSEHFGATHNFTADWDNGVYSWILAKDGTVYRQFVNASGELTVDEGEPTAAEEAIRAAHEPEFEDEPAWFCHDHPEQVATIAAECSVHPAKLPEAPEPGYLARWHFETES